MKRVTIALGVASLVLCGPPHTYLSLHHGTLGLVVLSRARVVLVSDSGSKLTDDRGRTIDGAPSCKLRMLPNGFASGIAGSVGEPGKWSFDGAYGSLAPLASDSAKTLGERWASSAVRILNRNETRGSMRPFATKDGTVTAGSFIEQRPGAAPQVYAENLKIGPQGGPPFVSSGGPVVAIDPFIYNISGSGSLYLQDEIANKHRPSSDPWMIKMQQSKQITKEGAIGLARDLARLAVEDSHLQSNPLLRLEYPLQIIYGDSQDGLVWIDRGPCK